MRAWLVIVIDVAGVLAAAAAAVREHCAFAGQVAHTPSGSEHCAFAGLVAAKRKVAHRLSGSEHCAFAGLLC